MTAGIHLVHKPVGPSSFAFMREVAGDAGRKICHGGVLDPFASGLLLILAGQATKLFDYLHDIPKVYEATVRWGAETDNGDPHGRVVSTGDPSALTAETLDAAVVAFVGWQEQTPPATSNKRVGGERAYVKAHRGEDVKLAPARVYLHGATWTGHELPQRSRIRVTVRGGYYVRALVRDLGRRLGCRAHLEALHRTSIGPWTDPGPDNVVKVQGRDLLPWLASRELTDQEVGELRAERTIRAGTIQPPQWTVPDGFPAPAPRIRGFHLDRFAFLLQHEDERLRALTVLRGGL